MNQIADVYGEKIEHRTNVRLGSVAGVMLRTKRGDWAMRVEDQAGGSYWLNVAGGTVTAPGGGRIGLVEELVRNDIFRPFETLVPALDELLEHDAWYAYQADAGGWIDLMIDYGQPPRLFLASLLRFGFAVRVDEAGRLAIKPPADYTPSPVFLEEIRKRQYLLVEILTPAPPDELAPYFGRLVGQAELNAALVIAQRHGLKLRATRSGAKYLLEIDSTPAPEVVRPQPKPEMVAA